MNSKKEVQHVYLVGAKSLGAYGGYETFVYKLTEYHQNKENIKYHVACKANGDGCMDESKFDGVTKINDHEFEFHNGSFLQAYTGIAHEIKTMLSRFAAISVRDENSAYIVRQLLGYSPEIHMDPVLMYDFTQEIAEYTTYERDYIILYAYTGRLSREEENYIKKFAKRHNKRIICVGHYSNIADKNIICNPLYVFSYFKNADYVITDTFHGTVFSMELLYGSW